MLYTNYFQNVNYFNIYILLIMILFIFLNNYISEFKNMYEKNNSIKTKFIKIPK